MEDVAAGESPIEKERRAWIERQERFKDLNEEYERRLAAAASPEERRQLQRWFSEERKTHRQGDVEIGKRSPGLAISMHQIMWARWIEVAVEHELDARRAYREIVAKPDSDGLLREFRASLVAITAAAHTIEALFGDIKYLVPRQPRRDKRHNQLRHAFLGAFGLSSTQDTSLAGELSWLLTLRDSAVHPYTESVAPQQHPAGINTGAEHSQFNAVTSGRAVDIALMVVGLAASPPKPHSHWIERWSRERAAYHESIQRIRGERSAVPLLLGK